MSAPTVASADPHRYASAPEQPIPDEALSLFQTSTYLSSLSTSALVQHIIQTRDQVFPHAPYPCLGSFRFLMPAIHTCGPQGTYEALLAHLKSQAGGEEAGAPPKKHLDLGCAMGQDTRKLIVDGVPSHRLVAADLSKDLMDAGHAMYDDASARERIGGTKWLVCDVFDEQHVQRVRDEAKEDGGYGSIYIGSFLHLFDLDEQKSIVKTLDGLLSHHPNSQILGRQVGLPLGRSVEEKQGKWKGNQQTDRAYRHDVQSFKQLWGSEWNVFVEQEDFGGRYGDGDAASRDSTADHATKRLLFKIVRKPHQSV
ncbi:hypothetical protein CBOM_03814 [Ceraceosorus bombacis]|uniref:Methyltransferase domain-containing protein n=1 Tax=Ceraceosorus bombacis TaxID=401625 RepID=A0A0P1BH31_9BASI|nr:hypothetical protein CBOM_03814 [Ceraceosorus bombacis]